MTSHIFDTYAVIEILKGNENFTRFLDSGLIINDFILAELSYHFLREYGKRVSKSYTQKYSQYSVRVSSGIIIDAMIYRYKHRKKNVSMADCISYIQAQSLGIKFLTGDKEFKGVKNVEFVK